VDRGGADTAGGSGGFLAGRRAAAQADNSLNGSVYDMNGKPYPSVQLVFTSEDNGRSFTVPVDEKGHYHTPSISAGTYDVDVKDKGQVVFRTGIKSAAGRK